MITLPRLPDNNTAAKILALIMAFVLWLYVLNEQNPALNLTYSVTLDIQNLAEDLVVTQAPQTIRVKIRGPRTVISNIAADNIKAFIDMQGAGKGNHDREVHVSVPGESQFVDAAPNRVTVKIDNFLRRTFPVDVKNTAQLPDDLQIASITPSPRYARVSGAENIVNKVVLLEAQFNPAQKTKGDVKADAPLSAIDENGDKIDGLLIEPDNVTITANFTEKPASVTVPARITLAGSLPDGFRLAGMTTVPDRVELTGTREFLSGIKEIYTEEISLEGVRQDSARRTRLRVPQGVEANPDTVEVTLMVVKE